MKHLWAPTTIQLVFYHFTIEYNQETWKNKRNKEYTLKLEHNFIAKIFVQINDIQSII